MSSNPKKKKNLLISCTFLYVFLSRRESEVKMGFKKVIAWNISCGVTLHYIIVIWQTLLSRATYIEVYKTGV